jgi:cytochrome b561
MRRAINRYAFPAIALHWLIALLIIATFLLGLTMVDIPGLTPTKLKYFSWHKWMGVTVFGSPACAAVAHDAQAAPPIADSMPAGKGKLRMSCMVCSTS